MIINYNKCLTNIANSILKYFEEEEYHSSLKELDQILATKKPQNVILILCDGMGLNLLERKLPSDSFLRKNMKGKIYSVFPPTTTAATTSIITGLNPCEHGWLGWNNYLKPIDKVVTMFLDVEKDTEKKLEPGICHKYFPYQTIMEKIFISGKYHSSYLSPFAKERYTDFDNMLHLIKNNCNKKAKNYIYAYYQNPDELMHDLGTNDKLVNDNFLMINNKLEKFCQELDNTVIIITADHGHIDSDYFILSDYPELFKLLERSTSIESRASMFFVKDGCQEKFAKLFKDTFGEYFLFLSKEEIINNNLFGIGKEHPYFKDALGDFIAISLSDKNIKYIDDGHLLKSSHGGATMDETLVPLIIVER